jgi:putative toxin-antitoxin system antitoxin component (TIGR02293 family)
MTHTATIAADLLGGFEALHDRIERETDLEQLVLSGIPVQAVRRLAESTDTTLTFLQEVAGIDRSTFARRVRAKARLKLDESDRIVRIARIAARAVETLGRESGLAWLHERNGALGDRIPIELLQTDIGTTQVEQVLGRIDYGVFS